MLEPASFDRDGGCASGLQEFLFGPTTAHWQEKGGFFEG